MSKLQSQMSSGKSIQRPSDDPASTGRTMALRAEKSAATQASRNAADGVSWLATIDTTLQSSISALRRARDLTIQGAEHRLDGCDVPRGDRHGDRGTCATPS